MNFIASKMFRHTSPSALLVLGYAVRYSGVMRGDVEQALQSIQSGSPASLDKALALLQDTVFSFSMKVCGHWQDAEDTAQDVLLKSIPHLSKFENPKALSVWLYRVTRNRCISSHRENKLSGNKNVSLDELLPDNRELQELLKSKSPSPESAAQSSQTEERLRRAVLAVPPQYRMVLVLHDMEDLSTAEVAQVMGLREGTVRVRLHRARLLLRQKLTKASGTPRVSGANLHAPAKAPGSLRCRSLFAALSDYMDGLVDDAVCKEMDRHIHDCEPCQAFLSSLQHAVAQCRSYQPRCEPHRAEVLRRDLMVKYQQATTALRKKSSPRPQ